MYKYGLVKTAQVPFTDPKQRLLNPHLQQQFWGAKTFLPSFHKYLTSGQDYKRRNPKVQNWSLQPLYVGFSGASEGNYGSLHRAMKHQHPNRNIRMYKYTQVPAAISQLKQINRPLHFISGSWGGPAAHAVAAAMPQKTIQEHYTMDPKGHTMLPAPLKNVKNTYGVIATRPWRFLAPFLNSLGGLNKSKWTQEMPVGHDDYDAMLKWTPQKSIYYE